MRALSTDSTISRARRPAALAAAVLALAGSLAVALAGDNEAEGAPGDNVIFILTDDQSATELAAMPNTQALIGGQGMTFTRAYIPYPLCCPSRASMLTGEYMHNHGVRGNGGPFGGWERLVPHESNTIATQLQDDGYYNVHIGKYVNGYAIGPPMPLPVPDGLGRVVRQGLGGTALLQLLADREGGAGRLPRADLLRRPGRRVPDRRAGRQGGRLHRRRGRAGDAVHDERLVQRPARSLRPGAAPPLHPVGAALPKLQAFDEKDLSDKPKWLQKQARKRLGQEL